MDENYLALLLQSHADKAETELMNALHQSDILSRCYAYRSRVKPEGKLIEKKNRKLPKKPEYKLTSITDVIGLRFVTLFRNQMPEVFEMLMRLLNHEESLHPNPFRKGDIEEVIVYHTSPYDTIVPRIQEIVEEKYPDLKDIFKPELSKEEYSSIHVVARLANTIEQLEGYCIPIEIQIRTVFEDAWGEIDHKYGYVIREGKDEGEPTSNSGHVLRHLKILKKFADACAEYADVIHSEATSSEADIPDSGKVISVASDEQLLDKFKLLGVPEGLIEAYRDAREKRKAGQSLLSNNREKGSAVLLQAAEKFKDLIDEDLSSEGMAEQQYYYLFYYYVRMNEAVCLLSTNKREHIRQALAVYEELKISYEDFPLLRMRLGQALGKLGESHRAVQEFEWAYKEAKIDAETPFEWTDELPEIDFSHMSEHLPTLFGFQLWKEAQLIEANTPENVDEKLRLLKRAYGITKKLVEGEKGDDDSLCKAFNNLLYYALDMATITAETHSGECESFVSEIPVLVDSFSKCMNEATCNDLEYLDTFAKAFHYVGDTKRAAEVVRRIITLYLSDTHNGLTEPNELREISREAFEMALEYGIFPDSSETS